MYKRLKMCLLSLWKMVLGHLVRWHFVECRLVEDIWSKLPLVEVTFGRMGIWSKTFKSFDPMTFGRSKICLNAKLGESFFWTGLKCGFRTFGRMVLEYYFELFCNGWSNYRLFQQLYFAQLSLFRANILSIIIQ